MKIAIAGYGLEGKANFNYWNTPDNQLTIVDEQPVPDAPDGAPVLHGPEAFEQLNDFDMVVRTAGLAPTKINTDGKVWSATNEFLAACPAPIIGVTGTKGKGTTSSLITAILRAAGKTVHLVGNIGQPALAVLPEISADDIVVYELSSFQLWDATHSPQVAVVLMIEPDHLDVHTGFSEYVAAKANITRHQTTVDRVVFFADNQWSAQIAEDSVGQRLPYPRSETTHIRGQFFYYGDQELCRTDNVQLPGVHNLHNACAAITAAWPWVQESDVIAKGLRSFDGLPHRLKFVRELDGVRYYDDSIATTPGSAIAAIKAFDEPKVIILGGWDKGADYTEVITLCQATGTSVVAIGQTGTSIVQLCERYDVPHVASDTLVSAVEQAQATARPGGVVILSPASASFGMFKNYSDRGEQFVKAVNALKTGDQ